MTRRMDLRAKLDPWSRRISLYAGETGESGRAGMAEQLTFVTKEDHCIFEPFVEIDQQAAQQLMDELWNCGLRPSEGSGSAGQAAAMQRHLDDMKAIAFHALKIKPGVKS